tara:strand:+ start:198 stop:617 length:420 start_codon:yes stop_codon:yes gene_type:complete
MIKDYKTQIQEKSDKELVDIFLNETDYQTEFVMQVKYELNARRIPIDTLKHLKQKNDKVNSITLELGKQGSQTWMILAFIFSTFGGIWAIFAGHQYYYSKHKDSNGIEYFVYNESTRKYGKWMLVVGISVLGLTIISSF